MKTCSCVTVVSSVKNTVGKCATSAGSVRFVLPEELMIIIIVVISMEPGST